MYSASSLVALVLHVCQHVIASLRVRSIGRDQNVTLLVRGGQQASEPALFPPPNEYSLGTDKKQTNKTIRHHTQYRCSHCARPTCADSLVGERPLCKCLRVAYLRDGGDMGWMVG